MTTGTDTIRRAGLIGSAGVAALAMACSSGVGSRPRDEHTSRASSASVTLKGCIEQRGNALTLRVVDTESRSGQEPAQFGDPDSSGGSLTHLPEETTTHGNGQSTTANGVWLGTRSYTLVGDSDQWKNLVGARVTVTGAIEPVEARPSGTDQMQAAQGAVFTNLRPTTVSAVGLECVGGRPGTTSGADGPHDKPSHSDVPAGGGGR